MYLWRRSSWINFSIFRLFQVVTIMCLMTTYLVVLAPSLFLIPRHISLDGKGFGNDLGVVDILVEMFPLLDKWLQTQEVEELCGFKKELKKKQVFNKIRVQNTFVEDSLSLHNLYEHFRLIRVIFDSIAIFLFPAHRGRNWLDCSHD